MILGAPNDGGDSIRGVIVAIGVVLAVIAMVLYLLTACTDPGIVFKHLAQPAPSEPTMPAGAVTHSTGSADCVPVSPFYVCRARCKTEEGAGL